MNKHREVSARRFARALRTARKRVSRARTRSALLAAPEEPRLCYRVARDEWWLRWPCPECGGTEAPLLARPEVHACGWHRFQLAADVGELDCPGCETSRKRLAGDDVDPSVWYDTSLKGWVVRLPWIGSGGSAIMPLEIPWLDAPRELVYRAATDLAYAAEAMDEVVGEDERRMERGDPDITP